MSVYDFIPFQTGSFDHSDIMYFCDCSWIPTQIRSFQCWNHYHSSDMKKCLKLFDHIQLPKGMAFKVGNMTEVQWEIHEHVIIIDASYMDWLKNINRTALCSHMCMCSNSYLMRMVSHQSLVQYQTLMNFSWRNIVVNKPLQQCLFYFIIFFKSVLMRFLLLLHQFHCSSGMLLSREIVPMEREKRGGAFSTLS